MVDDRDIFDAMFSVRHSVEEIVIQQGMLSLHDRSCFHAVFIKFFCF